MPLVGKLGLEFTLLIFTLITILKQNSYFKSSTLDKVISTVLAAFVISLIVSTKTSKKTSSKRISRFDFVKHNKNSNHYNCARSYSSSGGLRYLLFPQSHNWGVFDVWKSFIKYQGIETDKLENRTERIIYNYHLFIQERAYLSRKPKDWWHKAKAISPKYIIKQLMRRQNSDRSSTSSVPSKEAESLISFLAFEGLSQSHQQSEQVTKSSMSSTHTDISDEGVLEPATLIYHESARSIVFRDQIRRSNVNLQQLEIEHDNNHQSKSDQPVMPHAPNQQSISFRSQDEDTVHSHGSDSKSNSRHQKGSFLRRHKTVKNQSSSFVDSQHSVSSFDASSHNEDDEQMNSDVDTQSNKPQIIIANYTPIIEPLPSMELGAYNEFSDLLQSRPFCWNDDEGPANARINNDVWDTMSTSEQEVSTLLLHQKCVVKTVKRAEWTNFLNKFVVQGGIPKRYLHPKEFEHSTNEDKRRKYSVQNDIPYNSFVTSTSLLPYAGLKMRCYGSTNEYCLGVVFGLPDDDCEDAASKIWSWPAGYAAKTEFNISPSGHLINGREEALVSISDLRAMNHTYLYEQNYEILGKPVKGGLKTIPYNEIYLRVGGKVFDTDSPRSFNQGVGLPIALFTRSIAYGDLIALMRTKRRMSNVLGKDQVARLPLLYITPEYGVHVITETLQTRLLRIMTNSLNPFQNPSLQYKTEINTTSEKHLQEKVEELFDLDNDNIREILTPEECARLAGGFGATDDSVAHLLMDAMIEDFEEETEKKKSCHHLQQLVNEGLTSAVRSGDFNTSRQLLILYTLVASRGQQERERANSLIDNCVSGQDETLMDHRQNDNVDALPCHIGEHKKRLSRQFSARSSSVISERSFPKTLAMSNSQKDSTVSKSTILSPPPPPPLDTNRLRSATNSDGLLAVLGAAEVLKSMQNEAAKNRAIEAIEALEEWINKSEHSVSYRLAHWRDLTNAQGDLKIATEERSHLWHFVSNRAVQNRRQFVQQLRESVNATNFESITFLKSIHDMVSIMHSPCLRLELLQFILGLDNRYSVAHVARSVELAATCLNISAYEALFSNNSDDIVDPSAVDT